MKKWVAAIAVFLVVPPVLSLGVASTMSPEDLKKIGVPLAVGSNVVGILAALAAYRALK